MTGQVSSDGPALHSRIPRAPSAEGAAREWPALGGRHFGGRSRLLCLAAVAGHRAGDQLVRGEHPLGFLGCGGLDGFGDGGLPHLRGRQRVSGLCPGGTQLLEDLLGRGGCGGHPFGHVRLINGLADLLGRLGGGCGE